MADAPSGGTGLDTLSGWISGASFHVGIEVPDLEVARAFYVDLLGFQEAWILEDIDMSGVTGIPGLREKACLQLLVPGGSRIELQQYEPQGRVGGTSVTDQGLNHLSFGVKDVYAEYARLKAAGVEFDGPPIDLDFGEGAQMSGWTVVYFRDPWGLTLELLGPTPGRDVDDDERRPPS